MQIRKESWYYQLYVDAYISHRWWLADENKELAAEKAAAAKERLESGQMSLCPFFWKVVAAVVIYLGFFKGIGWLIEAAISVCWLVIALVAMPFRLGAMVLGDVVGSFVERHPKITRVMNGVGDAIICTIAGVMLIGALWVVGLIGKAYYEDWTEEKRVEVAQAERRLKNLKEFDNKNSALIKEEQANRAKREAAEVQRLHFEKAREAKELQRRQREYAEAERRQKERQAQEEQARLLWEATHPVEVAERAALERMNQSVHDNLIAIWDLEKSIRANRANVAKLEGYFSNYLGVIGFLIGFECLLGMILLWTRCEHWFRRNLNALWTIIDRSIDWMLIWMVVLPMLAISESIAWRWLVQLYQAWQQFWVDSKQLVVAFAKAKKERVCPLLKPVD